MDSRVSISLVDSFQIGKLFPGPLARVFGQNSVQIRKFFPAGHILSGLVNSLRISKFFMGPLARSLDQNRQILSGLEDSFWIGCSCLHRYFG